MNTNDIIERGFACLYENLGFIDTERFIAYVLTDEGYAEFMRRCADYKREHGVDSVENETKLSRDEKNENIVSR